MAEYIDRDKTIAEIDDCFPANPTSEFSKGVAAGLAMAKVAVNHTPTADVRPVVRGRWIKRVGENGVTSACRCSLCGFEDNRFSVFNYCPNCEAMMAEEGE